MGDPLPPKVRKKEKHWVLCGHKMRNIAKMDKLVVSKGYLRSNAEVWEGCSRLGGGTLSSLGVGACEEGFLRQWLL